jgi:hypothetical protein
METLGSLKALTKFLRVSEETDFVSPCWCVSLDALSLSPRGDELCEWEAATIFLFIFSFPAKFSITIIVSSCQSCKPSYLPPTIHSFNSTHVIDISFLSSFMSTTILRYFIIPKNKKDSIQYIPCYICLRTDVTSKWL